MDTRCEDLSSGGGASVAINVRRRRRDTRSFGSSTMIRARIAGVLARVLIAVALLTSGASVLAAEKWMTLGGLRVAVWSLPAEADLAQPVIVFSHGFLGCATQSRFLMQAFADAGYKVFAPNHRDAMCVGEEVSLPNRAFLP